MVALPAHMSTNEHESTAEFINSIKRYHKGIQNFRQRNPNLSMGKKLKLLPSIDDNMHVLVNARRYIDFPVVKLENINQLFELDFVSGSLSVFELNTHALIGTMYFNNMFDNWLEVFYNTDAPLPVVEEPVEESVIEPKLSWSDYADVIRSKLGDEQYSLWLETVRLCDVLAKPVDENSKVKIRYSGGGDDGSIDDVNLCYTSVDEYGTEKIEEIDIEESFTNLNTDYLILIYNLINRYESGYENNDGGYGIITISPTKFTWEHHNYYTDTTQSIDQLVNIKDDGDTDAPRDEFSS